jgi:hypothetical protein
MKTIASIVVLYFCIWTASSEAAQQIVVPNDLAGVEGNSSASDVLTAQSFRMQMVIESSQFSSPEQCT